MTLKRILLIVLLPVFLVFVVQTANAQSKGQKNKETSAPQSKYLLSILNYNAYCTGNMEPYIEFQFIIDGRTTKYVPDGDLFISEVDVRVDIVKKGENGKDEKVNGLHYILQSPHVHDSVVTEKSYFSDIQNVKVANGEYFLYFYLKDIHGTTDTIKYIDYLEVHFPEDRVSVSGISLWERAVFSTNTATHSRLFSNSMRRNRFMRCLSPLKSTIQIKYWGAKSNSSSRPQLTKSAADRIRNSLFTSNLQLHPSHFSSISSISTSWLPAITTYRYL